MIQVVSESVLIIIPKYDSCPTPSFRHSPICSIEQSYGENSENASSATNSHSRHSSLASKAIRSRKVCAKFGSGSRFGVGIVLERTCGPDCTHCSGDAFHRQCRFFDFRPHYQVMLETKDHRPLEKVSVPHCAESLCIQARF